jgi:hypothetical protein
MTIEAVLSAHEGSGIYNRICNGLKFSNSVKKPLNTVEDIIKYSLKELAQRQHIGVACVQVLDKALQAYGIYMPYSRGDQVLTYKAPPPPITTHPLHQLKLHEFFTIDEAHIAMRVSGGWLYKIGKERIEAVCFVPYSTEFSTQQKEKLCLI